MENKKQIVKNLKVRLSAIMLAGVMATTAGNVIASAATAKTSTSTHQEMSKSSAKKIKAQNIDKKIKLLENEMKIIGLEDPKDKHKTNVIRMFNLDYATHDNYKDISEGDLNGAFSFCESIGSSSVILLGYKYQGMLDLDIEECAYIPAAIFPKEYREVIQESINISEDYRKNLNKTSINLLDENQEVEVIENKEEYMKNAYAKAYNRMLKIVKSKEYLELPAPIKYAMFSNLSATILSGMKPRQQEQFKFFVSEIKDATNKTREELVKAGKDNKNQTEVLEKIIKDSKKESKEERQYLNDLGEIVIEIDEKGKVLVK